ncbi:MAG: xerC 3, partial [Acidobacteria bacterium]|nr:xerC 3 [Acidobacteriota bacterium]
MRDRIQEFLDVLALDRDQSPHTVRSYAKDLSDLLAFLAGDDDPSANVPIETIDPRAIRAWVADMHARGLSPATVGRRLSAARALFRWLGREGLVIENPAATVKNPKRSERLPERLDVEDVQAVLEAPDPATPAGLRDRALLELTYACGLRVSELVGLDLDDVAFSDRTARVLGKGRKERIVPFGRKAAAAVKAYLAAFAELRERAGEEALFLNQ